MSAYPRMYQTQTLEGSPQWCVVESAYKRKYFPNEAPAVRRFTLLQNRSVVTMETYRRIILDRIRKTHKRLAHRTNECPLSLSTHSSVGYVYVIQAKGAPVVKIGHSTQPEKRLRALQASSPLPLIPIALIPGDKKDEQRLHSIFINSRLHYEWFKRDWNSDVDRFCRSSTIKYPTDLRPVA